MRTSTILMKQAEKLKLKQKPKAKRKKRNVKNKK